MANVRIQNKRDTTANWNNATGFIPLAGEVIIYTDYKSKVITVEEYGEQVTKTIFIPGIKIGDGKAYVQDLPFVDDELRDLITKHIQNQDIHVTLQEKLFWNNKLNLDDSEDILDGELSEETLILNRN